MTAYRYTETTNMADSESHTEFYIEQTNHELGRERLFRIVQNIYYVCITTVY